MATRAASGLHLNRRPFNKASASSTAQKQRLIIATNGISAIHAPKGARQPLPQEPITTKILQKAPQGRNPQNILLLLIFCPGSLTMELNIIFTSKFFFFFFFFSCYPPRGEPRVSNGLLIATLWESSLCVLQHLREIMFHISLIPQCVGTA